MSSLFWHGTAALKLAEAFANEAERTESGGSDPIRADLLHSISRAYADAATAMFDEVRTDMEKGKPHG